MKVYVYKDEAGLTLVELLVAISILMIGLIAIMQWFPVGTQGMETGRRQSTAVFLAEQKIEQIKAFGLSTAAGQGFTNIPICNPCAGAPPFDQENLNTIPGYLEFNRTVIVQNGPTATTRLVRVQVGYRRVTSQGVQASANQVDIATIIAQH